MCIIINKPAGVTLSDEIIGNCFDSNPDGAGFAFADNGTVVISKGYFELGDLLNSLETVMDRHPSIRWQRAVRTARAEQRARVRAMVRLLVAQGGVR